MRRFRTGKVSEAVINRALELANEAPSAGNLQAREFLLVREEPTKRALSEAALHQRSIETGDAVVVFCANLERISSYGRRGVELYVLQDVAAAVQNFLLYVHSEGLAAVWIGAFDEVRVSSILGLPSDIRPLAIVPVGVPGGVPARPRRRPLEEMIHTEKW